MAETPSATRNWIVRKAEEGVDRGELRDRLEADGEDPGLVDEILSEEGLDDTPLHEKGFMDAYRESLGGVYAIDEHYFRRVPQLSVDRAVRIAAVNTAVPLFLLTIFFPVLLSSPEIAIGSFVTPIVWAIWVGFVAHALIVPLGGEDVTRTLSLYLVLTAFYPLLAIPFVNLFTMFYAAVATERGLEEVHDLSFSRAALVTVAAPVIALALVLVLMAG